MRLIDAEPIERALFKLADKSLAKNPYENARICAFRRAFELILNAPTIAPPPNDPLTLEELREMDGEPVWVVNNEQKAKCALTYSPCSIVYLTLGDGTHWDAEDLLDEGCKIYRRKPEKVPTSSDGETGPQKETEPWKAFLMTRFERKEGPA